MSISHSCSPHRWRSTPITDQPAAHFPVGRAELLDSLDTEGSLLIQLARAGSLTSQIAACPGWTTRDLLIHVGFVYRWAALIVSEARSQPPDRAERAGLADPDPGDDAGVIGRLSAAHKAILHALSSALPDLECWTLWPTSPPREFWIRRQVHETLIHRVDLQNAGRRCVQSGFDLAAPIATDGVDELICGFAGRYDRTLRAPTPVTLSLKSTDTGRSWWIRIGPEEPEFGRGPAAGDAEVHARSGELLLLLWNRRSPDGLDVRGDASALDIWKSGAHL